MSNEKDAKDVVKGIIADYAKTFSTEPGKRALADLRQAYNGSCFDKEPYLMAHKNGARDVILKIEYMIKMSKNSKLIEELFQEPEMEGFKF